MCWPRTQTSTLNSSSSIMSRAWCWSNIFVRLIFVHLIFSITRGGEIFFSLTIYSAKIFARKNTQITVVWKTRKCCLPLSVLGRSMISTPTVWKARCTGIGCRWGIWDLGALDTRHEGALRACSSGSVAEHQKTFPSTTNFERVQMQVRAV